MRTRIDAVTELLRGRGSGPAAIDSARPALVSSPQHREAQTTREAALLAASPFVCGVLLTIQGRLDATAARRLLDLAQASLSPSPRTLVVDLTATTCLDEFGRAALRRIIRQAERRGTAVYLAANPRAQRELGNIAKASPRFRIVPRKRIALAAAIAASAL